MTKKNATRLVLFTYAIAMDRLRPCSVYSMVDESSDEPKLFFLRHSNKLGGFFYQMGRISIKILSKSPENKPNFPTAAIEKIFIFYFFPPTKGKNLCWDPSTIEYTENGLT